MDIDELQRLVDRELKALPGPRAPETLLPRVLAATIRRKPAPWYARPWLAWPLRWQLASAFVLLVLGAGVSMMILRQPTAPPVAVPAAHVAATPAAPAPPSGVLDSVARIARTFSQAAAVTRACWSAVLEPFATWLLVVALSLSLACGALWSALERTALGGAPRQ